MQPITMEVPAEYIGVLKLFAAKDDFRYYLNGIALEIGPKESRLVATGAFWLGIFRLVSNQPTVTVPFTVIVPNSLLAHVKPNKGLVEITTSSVRTNATQSMVSVTQNGTTVQGEPIDGTYPNWRNVLPKGEVSGQLAQFNPAYIGDLAKAAALLHGRNWVDKVAAGAIGHNGDSAAVINLCHPDFTGAIMPWKTTPPGNMPTWAFDDLQVKEETVRERIARTKAA